MKHKFLVLLGLFLLLLTNEVMAEDYYADITFNVTNDGSTNISGTTNHPKLKPQTTQELTTKNKETWEILINPEGDFSEILYKILLPSGTEILDINALGEYRVTTENNQLVIIGTDQNNLFYVKINYKINREPPIDNITTEILFLILAIIIIGFAWKLTSKKQSTPIQKKPNYNKEALTERQLKIVELLEKTRKGITQAALQRQFNLPKASLSRNLTTLEKKGIIKKERKGMTMLITLKND